MSQSPDRTTRQIEDTDYFRNWDQLGLLIRRGHSFSGHERNCCFLNTGRADVPFADVSAVAHFDWADDGRALTLVDWDRDGDLDCWLTVRGAPTVRFLRNDCDSGRQYVALRLEGRTCNRDAVGARVQLELSADPPARAVRGSPAPAQLSADPPVRLIRTVSAGNAFLSQSSKWLHFGLGRAGQVRRVLVRWPGETTYEEFQDIEPGGRLVLVQGTGRAQRQQVTRQPRLAATPSAPVPPPRTDTSRVVLSRRLPVPRELAALVSGSGGTADGSAPRATLVTLWASWCPPCLDELEELARHADLLHQQRIRVVLVKVDGFDAEGVRAAVIPSATRAAASSPQFYSVAATKSLLTGMQNTVDGIFYRERPLQVPFSLLLDQWQRVSILYWGRVAAKQIVGDSELLVSRDVASIEAAVFPLGGRSALGWFPLDRLGFAKAYQEGGYIDDARREVQTFLSEDTGAEDLPAGNRGARNQDRTQRMAEAYYVLAQLEHQRGDIAAALSAYRRALQVYPPALGARGELALLLHQVGNDQEAEETLSTLASSGDGPQIHAVLGRVRFQMGQAEKAADHFGRAVASRPDDAALRFELAVALNAGGQPSQAAQQYQWLLDRLPNDSRCLNNLAWIFATSPDDSVRDGKAALRLALKLCQLTGHRQATYLDTLAAAYAEIGDFAMAQATVEKAIRLAKTQGQDGLMDVLNQHLAAFRRQQSVRQEARSEPSSPVRQ